MENAQRSFYIRWSIYLSLYFTKKSGLIYSHTFVVLNAFEFFKLAILSLYTWTGLKLELSTLNMILFFCSCFKKNVFVVSISQLMCSRKGVWAVDQLRKMWKVNFCRQNIKAIHYVDISRLWGRAKMSYLACITILLNRLGMPDWLTDTEIVELVQDRKRWDSTLKLSPNAE